MKRPIYKQLNIQPYSNVEELESVADFVENCTLSAVKTKYNKDQAWEAISLRGYGSDPTNILKPGVLKSSDVSTQLQDTYLRALPEMQSINKVLDQIPAEFERIRIMRLKSGTKISKHTDKVDKEIGFEDGEIVRLHVPIKTNEKVKFMLYEGKNIHSIYLQPGKYYYVDVTKAHEVNNEWNQNRLHLVVDCYSNQTLRDLILE